jgi:hypothetical protein
MTARTHGTTALRRNPLFQSYSRRLLFMSFLRSLRRQWKALRRKSWALVITAWRNAIDLDHVAAMRAVIVLTPLVLLAMISREVTISTFIVMERFGLASLGTLLHGAAIIVCYLALLTAQAVEPVFVLGCGLLAVASILLTGWDTRLGNDWFGN